MCVGGVGCGWGVVVRWGVMCVCVGGGYGGYKLRNT